MLIHVVDDDELARNGTARLLAAAGFDVRTYAGALEFLDAVEPDASGCIILDVQMPDQSGAQLVSVHGAPRYLRSDNGLPQKSRTQSFSDLTTGQH